jgi:pseudaminic acid biosynthesis-associated methylase
MAQSPQRDEGRPLDELWQGSFGDEYTERNAEAGAGRERFWRELLDGLDVRTALEVGCNRGPNLAWLAQLLGAANVAGVDVNRTALAAAAAVAPGARLEVAAGQALPFADEEFDLVFTTGVLIHVAPSDLELVMSEIVRCSGRYILCGEYYAEEPQEVQYRGATGALFKRDFGGLYQERFPELTLVRRGFLARDETPWDDVTWWLFERT